MHFVNYIYIIANMGNPDMASHQELPVDKHLEVCNFKGMITLTACLRELQNRLEKAILLLPRNCQVKVPLSIRFLVYSNRQDHELATSIHLAENIRPFYFCKYLWDSNPGQYAFLRPSVLCSDRSAITILALTIVSFFAP